MESVERKREDGILSGGNEAVRFSNEFIGLIEEGLLLLFVEQFGAVENRVNVA